MTYKALYRKWRPADFDELVGQKSVSQTLKNEIELGRIGHAYLFCGPRGTGKTSTARIFSRALNCQEPIGGNPCNRCSHCVGILDGSILDITEIDAASNNGVDNIRDLREEARFSGSVLSRRVYIIDEVHMLSASAFNALLKILEEPPQNVHFILATTEAHKVPATILSRCQSFDFRRIGISDIENQIKKIIKADGFTAEDRAIRIIAEKADGSMRDALSILDQCMSVGDGQLSYEDIRYFLGVSDAEYIKALAQAVANKDTAEAFFMIDDYVSAGKNITSLLEDFIRLMRNVLMCKFLKEPSKILYISQDEAEELILLASIMSEERLIHIIKLACETTSSLRASSSPRVIFETAVVRMINPIYDNSPDGLAARIGALEEAIAQGARPMQKKESVYTEKKASAPPPISNKSTTPVEKDNPPTVADDAQKEIDSAIGKIKKELYETNRLQTAMALECATLSLVNGVLYLNYQSAGECEAYRGFLNDENIDAIIMSIKKHTGLDVKIKIGQQEKPSNSQDNLELLYEKINKEG